MSIPNSEEFNELEKLYPSDIKTVKRKNFHGEPDSIQYLINVSLLLIPFISKIVIEYLKNKKEIVFIYKGLEIRNMNHKKITELLEQISENKDLNLKEYTLEEKDEN